MDIRSLDCTANLPCVAKCPSKDALRRTFNVNVGTDDRRVIASQLEGTAPQSSGTGSHHLLPCRNRAGKANFVYSGVTGEVGTDVESVDFGTVVAADHVENARGEDLGLVEELSDAERGERGERRGFVDNGVPQGNGGGPLCDATR